MRAVVVASCVVVALAGQPKPSDVYQSAIAKYVAGDLDAASDALAGLTQADIQKAIETSVQTIQGRGGSPAARRRLEAIALLHTEYTLATELPPKDVLFHIHMAQLSLAVSRRTLTGQVPDTDEAEMRRVRAFLPQWHALAASALLTCYADQEALTLVEDGLKLFPENEELLFWRGLVLEFHAVWVGTPTIDPHAALPAIRNRDPTGFDLLTNTRVWAPVEEAYRRVLQRGSNNAETHLHLGYALYSLRRYGDARTEYELARDSSTDPFVVYVGDLLLGRLKEDQNDLKGAVADYERAVAKLPGAQSAYVGLGSAEARLGNAQRAREVTEQFATIPDRQRVRDPWWLYRTTRVPVGDLASLRKAVRQ
jgi:tetratricopeptide (TPR) repeat protein